MHRAPPRLALAVMLALSACHRAAAPGGHVRAGTPPEVDIVRARALGQTAGFTWEDWGPEAFARARREGRYLLVDGAAEWCHWCHVMDETTYRDAEVGRLLRERFVAIRVDVDARPDLAERWVDYGWPATILLTPDAEEVGRYRGYLAPERLRALLQRVEALEAESRDTARPLPLDLPASPAMLPWVTASVARDLDGWYDPKEGGWGRTQKAPLGANVEFEVLRAARGDAAARERITLTLERQRAVLDPVWGGVYQYSAAPHWKAPHFEKLMFMQASNLEAYARAWALLRTPALLEDARGIARYLERFLQAPDGTFYANQDADVGAHDRSLPFVDGHVYYARDDAGRRVLGLPWVDTHVYARENGLAVAALVTLHEATGDAPPLAAARKAMDALLATHVGSNGEVWREATPHSGPRFLADAAALGRALALLARTTGEARYRDAGLRVGQAMLRDFADPSGGALYEQTPDRDAVGMFARRERPFAHNVAAARFLAALHALTQDPAWRERGRDVLAATASPATLGAQGRMLGDFLLAADSLGTVPWPEPGAQAASLTAHPGRW
ncbi:MAG: thioredoxin domain-containing protein [Myxococcaceae bacterium]|nr:MAG: thioredoxin domain-containing protein [Myxococcaceae bacterium]